MILEFLAISTIIVYEIVIVSLVTDAIQDRTRKKVRQELLEQQQEQLKVTT